MGNQLSSVRSLILTASGGPFRLLDLTSFDKVTPEEALKHPNWVMGAKITVDSATMMNKGLEIIEAIRLFNVTSEQVQVVVHPESVIHSLVEYCDGSWVAQLGVADMRIPISLALAYPDRLPIPLSKKLDLVSLGTLHFEEPDEHKFPCLKLAREAERVGYHGPVILNAVNEIAVERFLTHQIRFTDIPRLIEEGLCHFQAASIETLSDVIELDKHVKLWAEEKNISYRRSINSHEKVLL